jgi:long-chain acyl-CoA synthetase
LTKAPIFTETFKPVYERQRLSLLAEEALTGDPAQRAMQFGEQWYDWGSFAETARQVSSALDVAGITADMPVALAPRNCPGLAAALLVLLARGQPIVMIYAYQSAEGLARDIGRLDIAAAIILDRDWQPEVIAAASAAGIAGISLGDGLGGASAVPSLEVAPRTATVVRRPPELNMLTSGTTGAPKHFSMSYALVARGMLGEHMLPNEAEALPALLFFPFGNISGMYTYLPAALGRRPVVLLDRFNVNAWAEFVKAWEPEIMNIPPAGVQMALDAELPKEDLRSLRYIFSGAAALEPAIQTRFESHYGIPLLLSYGATEFGGPVTLMTPELHREFGEAKFGSVGRPLSGTQLRVIDQGTGVELPAGEEGILELIVPRVGPDWIRTTDLAVVDADGFLFHRGRADGAIMRGGFKIVPDLVEQALAQHPSIAAVSVVGLPDPRLGQVPVAAIQLRPGVTVPSQAELEAHTRRHVYATHVPVRFEIVDALPRTPSLKIDLPAVRALLTAMVPA